MQKIMTGEENESNYRKKLLVSCYKDASYTTYRE